MNAHATDTSAPAPVNTPADAEKLIGHLIDVMDALLSTVEEETKLVRNGRLGEATHLQAAKSDLAHLYVGDVLRLKASRERLAQLVPDAIEDLRQRHDTFRALLQINLTVLATAQAVSEGIVRGVSGEMQRKNAPQTYGASGRPSAPPRSAALPLAVSRKL